MRPTNSTRFMRIACIVAALCAGPAVPAQEDARTRDEVAHLLDYLGHSGCQFNRNGTWYDAVKAREHLQEKYAYLQKRNLVPDAQAFIDRAGAKSSMSGKPYEVRCGASQPTTSASWLGAELKRYRAAHATGR